MQEIRILTADIRANEEKIREHGKRADSIVKSMLQHSRSSTGQMEPTDVNALCEEYVRLAYHGMRAKEKNFNVDIRSYLSNGLPDVPMIRQDIGRVLLNIVNNAFHAVMERNSKAPAGYQPTVTIKTFIPADSRITAGKSVRMICMSIGDNGTGIPEALQKKIFQPFFTTKPTGQGTGLGLSLSYDIIRAHGGELTLESEPGRGTTFLIQLPIA
jgi:signal transduction histidine kinase